MDFWTTIALGYVAGFIAVQLVVRLLLRGEPTTHGQIVGEQVGCVLALLWPIALPYLAVVALWLGIKKLRC